MRKITTNEGRTTIMIDAGGQDFSFEIDEESVTIGKFEEGTSLGTLLIYENQIDAVIAELRAAKLRFNPTVAKLVIVNIGPRKLDAIKAVRMIVGFGLREAKDLIESAGPIVVKEGSRPDLERDLQALVEAGCTMEIR
jgi:ribosomal protein L7/L12